MEISSYLHLKIVQKVPVVTKARISCQVREFNIQRGTNNNLYHVLRLDSRTASFDEIKKAYKTLALQYHPDVSPLSRKEDSTRKFVELQRAYETLSDPVLRKMYDRQLCAGTNSADIKDKYSKEVWESQLCERQRRSLPRMERRKRKSV